MAGIGSQDSLILFAVLYYSYYRYYCCRYLPYAAVLNRGRCGSKELHSSDMTDYRINWYISPLSL